MKGFFFLAAYILVHEGCSRRWKALPNGPSDWGNRRGHRARRHVRGVRSSQDGLRYGGVSPWCVSIGVENRVLGVRASAKCRNRTRLHRRRAEGNIRPTREAEGGLRRGAGGETAHDAARDREHDGTRERRLRSGAHQNSGGGCEDAFAEPGVEATPSPPKRSVRRKKMQRSRLVVKIASSDLRACINPLLGGRCRVQVPGRTQGGRLRATIQKAIR